MESASGLIDLTLPAAASSSPSQQSHRRQSPPAVMDRTHNEDGGGTPSDDQPRRLDVDAIEHSAAPGQGGALVSSQQESGVRALLTAGAAAVDDAAVRQAYLGEDAASESGGEHQTEAVAAGRGTRCHAPLSSAVEGQTGAVGWQSPEDSRVFFCVCVWRAIEC